MKPINSFYTEEKFKYLPEKDRALIKQEFDFLDTLDLYPILEIARQEQFSIHKVMNYIEDIYECAYSKFITDTNGIDDFCFNEIVDDEFLEYIEQQYPFKRETAEISYITSSWDFHTKYKGE